MPQKLFYHWTFDIVHLHWYEYLKWHYRNIHIMYKGLQNKVSDSFKIICDINNKQTTLSTYNDDANGWYLLTKLLPSSYISTFCVIIVCFTDMISKYTLFQAFYSLLIFFGMFLWAFHFPEKYSIWVQCFFPHFTMK